ncbi:MAG TPA: protein jag [Candidatus Dorea intestinavium]|nr:protein jag [Candidatus Dorea intestinavium]
MDYITVSARNLDDAITEALIQLGITSDQLDYEVIEKGSAGFLGIGIKQAVIKARRKPIVKEEPVIEPVSEKIVEVKEEVIEKVSDTKEVVKEEIEVTKEVEVSDKKETVEILAETIKTTVSFIEDVLKAMDMDDVEVHASVDKDNILCINLEGKNMGLLIGKRGQTLDSLQYLANRVANKAQEGYVRIKLDTEDYRRRRKETLEHLARNLANKVKRTKRPVSLEPMNPYERRIIHSYLQDDNKVTTHSEGTEPYRKVVITYVYR